MGTRAQFFIGNPQDIENRVWLGCLGWDGYPDGRKCSPLAVCRTEDEFRAAVDRLKVHEDFSAPSGRGFTFPWPDNLFLTDWTYAFMDGQVFATHFRRGWIEMVVYLNNDKAREAYDDGIDTLPDNVPAPGDGTWDGLDRSIMLIGKKRETGT